MGERDHRSGGFFSELKRRKVVTVAITYGILGFAVVKAVDVMVDAVGLSTQIVSVAIGAALLGLPVVLLFAWYYEVVPDAAVREAASAGVDVRRPVGPAIRVLQAIGAAVIVVALVFSWFNLSERPPAETGSVGVRYVDSVAVMPLDNLTGSDEYDHLGISITEEIITHLARVPQLKVISRHSVEAVDRQGLTVPQIGSVLGVRHIIEGSVRVDDGNLLVTLQHISAETDAHAWAETIEGDASNLIAVQEEVARFATNKVVGMIPGIQQPSHVTRVELGPGHEAYIEGQRFLGQRTSDGLNRAIEYLELAVDLDQGHAPAYAALASAYALSLIYRYDIGIDGYEAAARASAYADRALQLDAELAAGFAARGFLGVYTNRPADAVAADFERAAELQPNAASIPSWRALSLAQLGQTDEALREAARAVDLDPLAPSRRIAVASISFELGLFDDAIAAGRMATTLEPRMFRGRALEARSMMLSGRADECAKMVLGPHRVLQATCLEANDEDIEAGNILADVLGDIRDGNAKFAGFTEVTTFEDLAVFYAQRGDAKNALFWVARAYSRSPAGIEPRLFNSALFDPVRDDANFSTSVEAIQENLYERVQRDSRKYQ